jgi:hypothetical protein
MVCTSRYNESDVKEPNFKDMIPSGDDDVKFICGQTFIFDGTKISVEAVEYDRKAYALRVVSGDEIKWVDNEKLQKAFKGKALRINR